MNTIGFTRNCPSCNKELSYSTQSKRDYFEYDEPFHNREKRKKLDKIRQENIISFLKKQNIDVKFYRYNESSDYLYIVN